MKKNKILCLIIFLICPLILSSDIWPFKSKEKEMLTKARDEYADGKYQQAIDSLNLFLEKGTVKRREKRAYLLLGQSYEQLGAPERALGAYLEGIELNPKDIELKTRLAVLYEKSQMYSRAVDIYQEILSRSPSEEEAVWGLARCYSKEGFFSKAVEYYSLYLKKDRKPEPPFWAEYSYAYYRQKMYGEALFSLSLALEGDGNNAQYWLLSSNINRSMGNKDDAYVHIEYALSLAPEDKTIIYTKAYWLYEDNGSASALKTIQPLLSAARPQALALYLKYLILTSQGNKKEALKSLQKIVSYEESGFITNMSKAILKKEKL